VNPFDLSASDLLVWGIVAHLIADWPLQNDWMADNKAWPWRWSIAGVLPALTHGLVHAVALGLVFGPWPGVVLGLAHIIIDTRVPVVWWSKFAGQKQPTGVTIQKANAGPDSADSVAVPVVDVALEVRFWTDQVFHITCIAIAALVVA
jgi:hypothetical protein